MYLVVQMHQNAVQSMMEAIDADRFHSSLEGARRLANGIKAGSLENYEVVELKTVWDTTMAKPRKMKW